MNAGKYTLIYLFSYMAIGAFNPMIGKYLEEAGFSGTQIGTVTATGTFVAIFAGMYWGRIYAGSTGRKTVLALLCISASAVSAGLMQVSGMTATLILYGLMYFFQAPILALVDATCIEEGYEFGTARLWGAVGYAGGVLAGGYFSDRISLSSIFVIYIACYVLAASVIAAGGKKSTKAGAGKSRNRSYKELFKNRKFRRLIIAFFFFGGTNVANNTYYSFMYTECGGTLAGAGAAMFLMIAAEAPFMGTSVRMSNRFTMEKMILAAMTVSAIRFALYSMGLPVWAVTSLFALQGFANGIALVEMVRYIADSVEIEMVSLATSAYYVISSNMSTILCQFLGGIVLQHAGGCGVYMMFAIYNAIGVVLYILFGLNKNEEKDEISY